MPPKQKATDSVDEAAEAERLAAEEKVRADAEAERLAAEEKARADVEAVPMARIVALFPLQVDGVPIGVLEEAEIRAELVAELLNCRAIELLPEQAD